MKKTAFYLVCIVLSFGLMLACKPKRPSDLSHLKKAPKGNAYYGGIFRLNEVEGLRTLFPPSVVDVSSHRLIQPIYEGLIRFSQKDLSVEPCLAYKWTVDATGTEYIFYIRRHVYFHEDLCFGKHKTRELTAFDVKYCLDKLCEPSALNKNYGYFGSRIAGAEDYYRSVLRDKPFRYGVPGVQVLGRYMLRIKLKQPYGSFIKLLGTAPACIYPREALERYGANMRIHAVGTGPFMLEDVQAESLKLERNPRYWQKDAYGNQLPYLNGIQVSFLTERKAELMQFNKGQLELMYGLPSEFRRYIIDSADRLTKDFKGDILQVTPVMTAQYDCFLLTAPQFSDARVRMAFSYAIDKEALVKNTLKGSGYPGIYGMVPPVFKDYPYQSIHGYHYDPDSAKLFLAAAGFPDGKGFPEINLLISSEGAEYQYVAEAVRDMLIANLNIKVKIESLPWAEHLEKVEKGNAQFWRYGWQADYPDPESFLNLCYSIHIPDDPAEPAYLNSFRYKSEKFDKLFSEALVTTDQQKRMALLARADQQVMSDAGLIVLFYAKDYRLLQPYVRNFDANPMEVRDFSQVYFDKGAIEHLK